MEHSRLDTLKSVPVPHYGARGVGRPETLKLRCRVGAVALAVIRFGLGFSSALDGFSRWF